MSKKEREELKEAILRSENVRERVEKWNQWADMNSLRVKPFNVTITYYAI